MFDVPIFRTNPRSIEFFHLSPGAHVVLVDVGNGMWVARGHVAAEGMVVGKRPVDEVKIEVVHLKVSQRLLARSDYVIFAMLIVPKLGGDPNLIAVKLVPE